MCVCVYIYYDDIRAKHGSGPLELDAKVRTFLVLGFNVNIRLLKDSSIFQMSAYSQNHATSLKGATGLSMEMHSKLQAGLTNSEGLSINGSPEGAMASQYSEIEHFDFNNPVETGQNGKFAIIRITNFKFISEKAKI